MEAPPPRQSTSVYPGSLPFAVRSAMEAPGIHLALWLLTFTMLLPMLSTELMFPPGVRNQLCESGHLGIICNQPVKKGHCTFRFYRYYFNKDTALCELFIFSGCGGNRNNFKSKYLCELHCIEVEVSLLLPHPTFKDTAWLGSLLYRATSRKRLAGNEQRINKSLPHTDM
eukprot:XP_006235671.1 PREDICTED: serine peptidase inhibitor, Kunitz type 5 isoform X1 [Rattus norvegicus]